MSARLSRRVLPALRDLRPQPAFQFAERRPQFRFSHQRPVRPVVSRPHITNFYVPRAHNSNAAHAASLWTLSISLALACGGLALTSSYAGLWSSKKPKILEEPTDSLTVEVIDPTALEIMTVPTGHVGNLTAEEELKLKELWGVLFKLFGVTDSPDDKQPLSPTSSSDAPASDSKKSKRKFGLFGKKDGSATPKAEENGTPSSDADDKYGQTKEYNDALATHTPEELGFAFWSMVKQDHPDALLLRFLRARKWDVNRAVIMLISALHWRAKTIRLEDEIMKPGDTGALEGTKSSDPAIKKESEDFMNLLRLGESFMHGKDKCGRPVCYIRVRLHKAGVYCEAALEKYTVYLIETSRLLLEKPAETAALVFDMTDFSLANMDYAPVKFMIKCFEANYPESLGVILVHKAPWIFQRIWTVIKGWLDPVVASKVHFTKTPEDIEAYISRSQLIKEVGGDNSYEYKYVEPVADENTKQNDTKAMEDLVSKRFQYASEFQRATRSWISTNSSSATGEAAGFMKQRYNLASKLHDNYWQLDPHVRARSLYDRIGDIPPGKSHKGLPSRTTSVRTTVSTKHSFEVVTTRPIVVDGNGDEVD